MAKESLKCLFVFALADKTGREALTEVVESESLSRFQPDAHPNRGGTYLGTVEVWGSSPHGPTIVFIGIQRIAKILQRVISP